jgi:hypothetical protein
MLWIVNFYVIAPVFGWTWFADDTIASAQFLAHTLGYGCVLGLVLTRIAAAEVRRRERSLT